MNKIILKRTTSSIILTIVLITGTFAAISPSSFIIKGGNAQSEAESYKYGMDDSYHNYNQNYGMDGYDKRSYDDRYGKNSYSNSYEPDYGNDNRYDSYEPEYTEKTYNSYKPDHYGIGNDYDKKSYGYEPKYPSYEKDDKSKKDDSNKVEINKIKCINTNLNINGNNAGNVSIGNKGTGEEGYLGASSAGDSGYGIGGYGEHNKKDKVFDCIINNNNTNINTVGGGNQTEQLTCEECFTENLSAEQLNNITIVLSVSRVGNLEGVCEELISNTTFTNIEKLVSLRALFDNASITDVDAILRVLECLEELRLIIVPPNFDPIVD